ncbi:MAG: redoxin domain-containing protein [Proteobacteria bacterium]|nr:redoxin domain-containing protein [Pseudomonadota bacterium]
MIQTGDKAPNGHIRTREGTSISLLDLKGRSLAVFLLGHLDPATVNDLLTALTEHTDRFLTLAVSPIVVLSEPNKQLRNHPRAADAPYLITVDVDLSLHKQFQGVDGTDVRVWIMDDNGVVIDTIPVLPPVEQVRLAVERAGRPYSRNQPEKTRI